MRKNDIKPGVIYAYQRGRGDWDTPSPIVFLTAPADGTLYRSSGTYSRPGAHEFSKAHPGAKPGAGSSVYGAVSGYAAVTTNWNAGCTPEDWNAGCTPEDLLKLTLADFEKTTDGRTGIAGTRFTVVTSLTFITGEYGAVMAARKARQDAKREQYEQENAERNAAIDRTGRISKRLAQYGAVHTPDSRHTGEGYIRITLADAEKLLVLLESDAPQD